MSILVIVLFVFAPGRHLFFLVGFFLCVWGGVGGGVHAVVFTWLKLRSLSVYPWLGNKVKYLYFIKESLCCVSEQSVSHGTKNHIRFKMATGTLLRRAVGNKFKDIVCAGRYRLPACLYSVEAQQNEAVQVQYPPVKPQYPPGSWGSITPAAAWELHEEACELNDIPKARERLERMAGQRVLPSWRVCSLDAFPGTLTYKQHITRTHVIDDMPPIYGSPEMTARVAAFSEQLKPILIDLLVQEHESHFKVRTKGGDSGQYPDTERHTKTYPAHVLLGQIVNSFYANLASKHEYLLRSQLDENVRVECFWFRGGYEKKVTMKHDRYRFQTANSASYQIRTELPLPEVCMSLHDDICQTWEI